jgi:hypothetical protein
MSSGLDFVPPKKQYREESRFQEKRKDAFGRQGASKNVADETRVRRPIHSELKLHDNTARHAQREDETEDFDPESCHLMVDGITCPQIGPFHDHQEESQADTQGREEIMETYGGPKLDSRKQFELHECILV